jgi:hypothetical protein
MIASHSDTQQADAQQAGSHKEQYQGKNLLMLLIALCGPAGLLFLRSVFGRAGQPESGAAAPTATLQTVSTTMLVLFYLAQIAAAWYMRRMLPARHAWWSQSLQFFGLLVMGLFFSLVGATMLEAFGYSLWMRLHR